MDVIDILSARVTDRNREIAQLREINASLAERIQALTAPDEENVDEKGVSDAE